VSISTGSPGCPRMRCTTVTERDLQRRLRGTPISHTESADNEWAIGDPEHTGTPWDVSGNG
jgi:hypothetical protein